MRRVDAVHLWHLEIHQHDIWPKLGGQRYSLFAVRGKPDDCEIRLKAQDHLQPLAHNGLVVGDEYTNWRSGSHSLFLPAHGACLPGAQQTD